MGRNGEESVEKKCTSNLDTGLIRGIILMIIPLSSPLDFVLVARNQIRITGAFFLTNSSTVMSVRWQTFNFKKLLTKYPIIPTACHLLHSPHPIPGAASRRPPRGIQQGRDK